MNSRYLLDTNAAIRWLDTPNKLAREQVRVMREAIRHNEPFSISAMTLLEIGVLSSDGGRTKNKIPLDQLLDTFESDPTFHTIPITVAVAKEVAVIGRALRDPADRAIVATARVHRLKLITSDQRIIESGLVPVVT